MEFLEIPAVGQIVKELSIVSDTRKVGKSYSVSSVSSSNHFNKGKIEKFIVKLMSFAFLKDQLSLHLYLLNVKNSMKLYLFRVKMYISYLKLEISGLASIQRYFSL
jgi:hypothetical protein